MAASGLLVAVLFFLHKAEAAKGRRVFLSSLRSRLDAWVLPRTEGWNRWKKYVGASSFRLFLHYLLHQGLGLALFVIRWIETRLSRLRRRNKLVAKVAVSDTDNHLSHIARHKEEVALSEEEIRERKERSLNDQ